MTYIEVKERNNRKYFYRVISVREGKKIKKKRKYLGVNLSSRELKNTEDKVVNKELEKIKPVIIKILKKYKIKHAGIFGSYARGEQKKKSDIDILLQPGENMSLLDLSGLKIELEDELKKKVDLVSYNYIHPKLKERILNDEVRII